jgi:subtilase family serine protease
VQIAHGICPDCKILLVEAKSNSFANLMAAVDYASSHANVVSNSYGASEFSGETSYDFHFNHVGVPITVSSGDNGYGVEYPAASQYVTAVGGTTLSLSANGSRASETAWSGAGSGCSAYEPKPSWQTDTGCARRTVADVSADADPASGAAVYDSYGSSGQKGWFTVGGTSLAAPLVAGVYGLAGNGASTTYASFPYAHSGSLYDVVSGSNGSCSGSYLCTSVRGFDGPTGLGTPAGIGAF